MSVNQHMLATIFNIPPSRADIRITGPLTHVSEVQNGLFQMGLTADDLKPVDWRNGNISATRNQENCGDCWAMSSTSALQDRFMIKKGLSSLRLEPAVVAQCSGSIDQGCNGGQPFVAGQFFENVGLPEISDNCPAWSKICTSGGCTLPTCSQIKQSCNMGGPDVVMYRAKKGSTKNLPAVNGNTVDKTMTIINMKRELINGPIVAAFFVPVDFMASGAGYKWDKTNGIFINGAYNDVLDQIIPANMKQALGNPSGKKWQDIMMEGGGPAGHAVEVVGWDTGDAGGSYGKVSYWIVRNSWGTDWGDNGFFKIAMNDDSNNNQYLGFDIPVSTLTIASTGQQTNIGGGLFGGCISFDPDTNTGKPGSGPQTVPSASSNHKTLWIILGVVGVLLIGLIVMYIKKRK